MTSEVEATRRVIDAARSIEVPIIFTTIGFEKNLRDGSLWIEKAPALADLQIGGEWVELDERLGKKDEDTVILKKGASAFFGTNLASIFAHQKVDTVVLCGAPTSGCIRATAVDLLQHG